MSTVFSTEMIDTVAFLNTTAFWTFMATVAFVAQIVLQHRYATATVKKVNQVGHTVVVASEEVGEKLQEIQKKGDEIQKTNQEIQKKGDEIQKTGEQVHKLVNNAMSLVLAENALLARRIAKMTGLPEDVANADRAEKAYQEHDQHGNHP